jgi:N-ethylmaleimide reductase
VDALFSPFMLSDMLLSNRIVMAPMTRNRAAPNGIPSPLMAIHYGQRGDAGLVISESAPVSAQGVGYPGTPGIYTEEQAQGWRKITDAVHAKGGHIFAQLQHCGRISHPSLQVDEELPVAPSAIKPEGLAVTYGGMQPFLMPRELSTGEVPQVVDQFKKAAAVAKAAGFDGVEIHAANGYLIDQFLRDGSNQRSDRYGGSPARRLTLLLEIVAAVGEIWPQGRIGVRFSPENRFNDMYESDPAANFGYYAQELSKLHLAYLHLLEGDMSGSVPAVDYRELRRRFGGTYIANNGYDRARAMAAIEQGSADLIAFGKPFIANPDLVTRLRHDLPLAAPDSETFYGGDVRGYTDYATATEQSLSTIATV